MNPASQPLVSVVTPVYNEAAVLAECIESVLAQTYQSWDFTIVNNCSTDDSLQIARRYAASDSRIRVHDNEKFLRAVPNHNVALRMISPNSMYCKVLLADDWLFPECLERMVALAEKHPSVGIVGAYGLKANEVEWVGLPYPTPLISGREIVRKLFLEELYVFGSATSVLYRSDIVRAKVSFYNESNFHADKEACVAALKTCDFGFVHQILTYSRVRPGSLETISNDFNTITAGKLHDLVTYGKDFLTPEEYKACMDFRLFDVYATLVGGVLRNREKKFWDFHKGKLKEAGIPFSRAFLAKVALMKLWRAIFRPRAGLKKARQISHEISERRRVSLRGETTS